MDIIINHSDNHNDFFTITDNEGNEYHCHCKKNTLPDPEKVLMLLRSREYPGCPNHDTLEEREQWITNGHKVEVQTGTDEKGEPFGKPFVAIDSVDAGVGDLVLTASGSSARQTTITKDRPVDAVIMAVIDSLEVDGKTTFRKS